MSIHDDSSTVLSVRGSEGLSQAPDQADGTSEVQLNYNGKSPYTDSEIIALDVGLSKTRYRIHRSILLQSPELGSKPSLKLWGEKTHDTLSLPDLDEITAHTLIHFLYTGRYQTLEPDTPTAEKSGVSAFKLSTCVYCAATRYKLPLLAELAQEKITALGNDLTIFDVLGVARDHAFPILPEDETWFPSYLEGAIKSAVSDDSGLFVKPGFVEQITGDIKFRQVVVKAMVNTYSPSVETKDAKGEEENTTSQTREDATSVADSTGEGNVADETLEPGTLALTAEDEDAAKEDSVHLDDIEPSLPESPTHRPASPLSLSPNAPESVTDELDFKNSKTYQSMGRMTTPSLGQLDGDEEKPVTHVRNDSVIQAENTTPDTPEANEQKDDEVVVTSPAAEPLSKKAKKKGKKGKKAKKDGDVAA